MSDQLNREKLLELAKEELLVDGGLIYALRNGMNYYEICVTMAAGDRASDPRHALALQIADLLSAAQAEPKPISEQNVRFAIDGAIDFGRMGSNPPSPAGHWLTPYWEIGRQLAAPPSSNQTAESDLKRRLADMCREYEALAVKLDQTWNEAIEAAAKRLEGGSFLHDEAPTARLAREAAKAIRTLARPSQAQEPSYEDKEREHFGDPDKRTGIYAQPVSGAVDERLSDYVKLVFQCARYERPSTDWIDAGKIFLRDVSALSQQPAQVTPDELPPLPERRALPALASGIAGHALGYTAGQMREYARLALSRAQPTAFREHLKRCSDTVATWPDWKRRPSDTPQPAAQTAVPEGWRGAAEWLRNNYQDHINIADLCDAMIAAAPQPVAAKAAALDPKEEVEPSPEILASLDRIFAHPQAAQATEWQCATCKKPLKPGYACVCGSDEAEAPQAKGGKDA